MSQAAKKQPEPEVPKQSIRTEVWTPQRAKEALRENKVNRKLREQDVDRYQRAMTRGHWGGQQDPPQDGQRGVCTEPLVFDWNGNLIDGQHRLNAQIQAEATIQWFVLRGVPPETQKHINTAVGRTAADQLSFMQKKHAAVLGGVARWAFMLSEGRAGEGKFKVSVEEIVEMVENHKDLEHSAYMGMYARNGLVNVSPTPVGAAHWWIAQHNNHAEADMFIDRLVRMNHEGEGSAVLALLKRFANIKNNNQHVTTRDQIVMILKAWNYDVEGKYVSKINTYNRDGVFRLPEVLVRGADRTRETPLEDADD